MRWVFVIIGLLTFLLGCEEEAVLPDSKANFAKTVFSGRILSSEQTTIGEDAVWKITLANEQQSEVVIYVTEGENRVVRMEGIKGPFTYDADPKNGLKSFSQVKILAVTQLKNDDLINWRMGSEEKYQDKLIYTLEFDADANEDVVEVDAETGMILSID